ncbi:MAG: efflux RND transporter periplasmic adaptor subunit [Alkalispirochaeta sp.]
MFRTKTRGDLCAHVIVALQVLVIVMVSGLASCAVSANAQTVHGEEASPERTSVESGGQLDRVQPVRVFEVSAGRFVHYGAYLGKAEGVAEVELTAAGGRVTEIRANEGDQVRAGQSLAAIDAQAAEVRYRTAEMNERLAEESYAREQRFLEQGSSYQLKVDQAHLAWLQSQSALLDAQKLREAAFAITPISGVVLSREIELHQKVDVGDLTFRVGDLSRIRISVGIPEADIAQADLWSGITPDQLVGSGPHQDEVANGKGASSATPAPPGLTARVVFPAMPGAEWDAEIERVSLSRSDRTLTYEVNVLVDNSDFRIRSGQTAQVRVPLNHLPNALVVPTAAVYTRGRDSMVMVVTHGTIDERVVQLGPSDNTYTVIKSGVESEDRVVREGMNRLVEGDAVEIVDDAEVSALSYAPAIPQRPRATAVGDNSPTN